MARPIDADYSTQWLLPPSLEDLVPKDHPARFLRECVDRLDLNELGFGDEVSLDGRPAYSKALLLKVWLYGYWQGIRSHRKLEQACREHLSLLWLTGMHQPDHNTLWRFWNAHRDQVRKLFLNSVRVAMKTGLVSLALTAVDGTKIEAASSRRSGWSKEKMETLLANLEEQLKVAEEQLRAEAGREGGEYRLPKELEDKVALKEAVQKGLKELEQSERKHYHRHEPEARKTQCGGVVRFAYNAQAAADEKAGIIVACDVTNQENDVGQLPVIVQQAQQNVSEPGSQPAKLHVLADSGYGSACDIAKTQLSGCDVLTPGLEGKPSKNKPYHSSNFVYEPSRNVCICPRGEALPFVRMSLRKDKAPTRVYRCTCKDCPVRSQCTKDRRGRQVELCENYEVVQAVRQRLNTPEGKAQYQRRSTIIEPRFAWVKGGLGFRRWARRGLDKAKAQWHWVCLTSNLQVLFGAWLKGAMRA